MWPACVFSWRNTTRNITRAYQFSNSPIASDLPLILTNSISPSPGDIMTRHQVRGWPGDNRLTSDVLWSPNSGPCPFYASLSTVSRNQDVWKTRGDLRQQGGLPDWPGPWWGDQVIRLLLSMIIMIRSRLCSGGSPTRTITSPRPQQTRAWQRNWREYQTLWRYYTHLLILGWVFIDP